MSQRERSRNPVTEVLRRIGTDLAELANTTSERKPSASARRRLDAELRDLIARAEALLRDLDPIQRPRFMFDPGDPAVVGRFIGLAMIAQPRSRLPAIERFYGSGIYALYYKGEFPAYAPISGTETPIYVGKADPQADTAKTPLEQGTRLSNRLKDHLRNIGKAADTLNVADFDCRSLVVQSGWQGAAEDYLIHVFRPVWNSETGICFGLGKHGDSPSTRANLRSPWDTLHPGRDWAGRDPAMGDARPRDQILDDLRQHFLTCTVYRDLEQILDEFINELRQL